MNYAILKAWSEERAEELVAMGVPRAAANEAMHYVEVCAINAESEARKEDQLLLDFKTLGSRALAERHGVTARAICKRRDKILRNRTRNKIANTGSIAG
jgi:hypothetical protein